MSRCTRQQAAHTRLRVDMVNCAKLMMQCCSVVGAGEKIIMVMAVYSRLGRLLATRDIALGNLRAELLVRYNLDIDIPSLEALAREERLQQPNIELVAAIAAILEVRLDDLLDARCAG